MDTRIREFIISYAVNDYKQYGIVGVDDTIFRELLVEAEKIAEKESISMHEGVLQLLNDRQDLLIDIGEDTIDAERFNTYNDQLFNKQIAYAFQSIDKRDVLNTTADTEADIATIRILSKLYAVEMAVESLKEAFQYINDELWEV